jgi:hypothetical protein
MRRWFALGLLVLVACAAPAPRTNAHWRQINEGAEPIDVARPACKAYALDRSKNVKNQGLAAKAAAGAFAECMRERGWALVDQE